MKEMMMTMQYMVRNISLVNPLAMPKLMSDDTIWKMQISPRIYLNSDMMVGSGQPRSSTSSTVEFWSENEKQRFTWDFDHIQLLPNIQLLKGQVEQKKLQLWSLQAHLHTKCAIWLGNVCPAERMFSNLIGVILILMNMALVMNETMLGLLYLYIVYVTIMVMMIILVMVNDHGDFLIVMSSHLRV